MLDATILKKYPNVLKIDDVKKNFKKITSRNKKHNSIFNTNYVKYVVSDSYFYDMIYNSRLVIPATSFVSYEYGDHNIHNIGFEFTGYVVTCNKFTLYINTEDFESCIPIIDAITKKFEKRNKIFLFPEANAYFNDVTKLGNFISTYSFPKSMNIFLNIKNPLFINFNNVFFNISKRRYEEVL